MLRTVVVVLVCLSLCAVVSGARVSTNLIYQFAFLEGQYNSTATRSVDQASIAASSPLPYIGLSGPSFAWSPQRQGLQLTGQYATSSTGAAVVGVQSTTRVASALSLITDAITIEAWLSFADFTHSGMITGFGKWDPATSTTSCIGSPASPATGARDWQFYQSNGQVLTTLSRSSGSPLCQSFSITLNTTTPYHHIVTTVTMLTSSTATVVTYYNGAQVSSSTVSQTSFSDWVSHSNTLQLSAEQMKTQSGNAAGTTWQGSIYLLAMYTAALSASEVLDNYQAGLPNSAPVFASLAQIVTVLQNSSMVPLAINLNATDFDGNSLMLLVSTNPDAGTLYFVDTVRGINITLSDDVVPYLFPIPTTGQFYYTPVPNSWGSNYGSFVISAYDRSAFSVAATVTINVQHIFIPPVPMNVSVRPYAGQLVLVMLNGTDMDPSTPLHAPMTGVFLMSLPLYGQLYQYTGSLTTPGAAITTTNTTIISGYYVLYKSTTPLSATRGANYLDYFIFGVVVKNTSSVTAGVVSLTVSNPLTASNVNFSIGADSPRTINLAGGSAFGSRIYYYLMSVPSVSQGNLTLSTGQVIVPYTGTGSPWFTGATILNSSALVFTSAVSLYAGRYDSRLDPSPVSFSYSVVDGNGNTASGATVNLRYNPIHHAPSLVLANSNVTVNAMIYNGASQYWTRIPATIFDADAATGSAWSTVAPTFPPQYTVTATLTPTTGALIRLDPARTAVVQVLSGDSTGSTQVAFTCAFAACNAALAGLQLQANCGGTYSLTMIASQSDTSMSANLTILITANALPSSSTTGGNNDGPSGSNDNSPTLASLFSPSSKWFWVLIGSGVAIIILASMLWRYRRARKLRKARSSEITAVAVEFAKAVGGSAKSKETMDAEIEVKATAKAAEMNAQQWDAIGQALASPRLALSVADDGYYPAPLQTCLNVPNWTQTPALSPRLGALMPLASPRTPRGSNMASPSYLSPRMQMASPRSTHNFNIDGGGGAGVVDTNDIELAIQEQQYQIHQQQQQLTVLRQFAAASPRSPSAFNAPSIVLSPRPAQLPLTLSQQQAQTARAPLRPQQHKFNFSSSTSDIPDLSQSQEIQPPHSPFRLTVSVAEDE